MAYIYLIENDINHKLYIGLTLFSISKRFKAHCRDAFRKNYLNRPLYKAMRKYGIKHFHISIIEETEYPNEREKYWIELKRTFKNGYNATLGGDGTAYLDYDILILAYKKLQNLSKVAELYHCDKKHLSTILKANNIQVNTNQQVCKNQYGIMVDQYDLKNNYIKTFSTIREAAYAIAPNSKSFSGVTSHISDVCKGRRKTAYGYIWKYNKLHH